MIHPSPNRRLALVAIAAAAMLALPAGAQVVNEDFKVLPIDGETQHEFGSSIAISGNTMIVGVSKDDDNTGSAYLFDATTGQQLAQLVASDRSSDDRFGVSVAISGKMAIVGADGDSPYYASGSAYLFDTTTGQQIFKLAPEAGNPTEGFGFSVGISDEVAIVGAVEDNQNGHQSGAAFLYDTSTGQLITKLLPDDGHPTQYFGLSVAISGTTAIIGAYGDYTNGTNAGAAYIFDTTTGEQIHKLFPDDPTAQSYFGYSVAISGNKAVVGAHWDDDNGHSSGSAYIFDTTSGQQIAKLLPHDGEPDDWFGYSVAISNDAAVIGSYRDDDNDNYSGSAYFFDSNTGQQIAKALPSDGSYNDNFGKAVSIDGSTAAIAAPRDDDNGFNSGSAYVVTTTDSSCSADLNNDGSLDFFDVSAFLTAYNAQDPTADFNADGSFNFFDVSAFVEAYLNGCP